MNSQHECHIRLFNVAVIRKHSVILHLSDRHYSLSHKHSFANGREIKELGTLGDNGGEYWVKMEGTFGNKGGILG